MVFLLNEPTHPLAAPPIALRTKLLMPSCIFPVWRLAPFRRLKYTALVQYCCFPTHGICMYFQLCKEYLILKSRKKTDYMLCMYVEFGKEESHHVCVRIYKNASMRKKRYKNLLKCGKGGRCGERKINWYSCSRGSIQKA